MQPNAYRHILRTELSSFGYGKKVYERDLSKDLIREWIKEIDHEFHLILITEYFDYSLALLGKKQLHNITLRMHFYAIFFATVIF